MQRLDDHKIDELIEKIDALTAKVEPLVEIYTNSLGAYKTVTWFLKLAAMVGAGIGAIIFLKKI
jgi:hypothetical protein